MSANGLNGGHPADGSTDHREDMERHGNREDYWHRLLEIDRLMMEVELLDC